MFYTAPWINPVCLNETDASVINTHDVTFLLCSSDPWVAAHAYIPFLLYLYIQAPTSIKILLVYGLHFLYEGFESIIYSIDYHVGVPLLNIFVGDVQGAETLAESVIGDVLVQGTAGIILGWFTVRIFGLKPLLIYNVGRYRLLRWWLLFAFLMLSGLPSGFIIRPAGEIGFFPIGIYIAAASQIVLIFLWYIIAGKRSFALLYILGIIASGMIMPAIIGTGLPKWLNSAHAQVEIAVSILIILFVVFTKR
jgi:hypothetical protein